jgi:hypothetical protein
VEQVPPDHRNSISRKLIAYINQIKTTLKKEK